MKYMRAPLSTTFESKRHLTSVCMCARCLLGTGTSNIVISSPGILFCLPKFSKSLKFKTTTCLLPMLSAICSQVVASKTSLRKYDKRQMEYYLL